MKWVVAPQWPFHLNVQETRSYYESGSLLLFSTNFLWLFFSRTLNEGIIWGGGKTPESLPGNDGWHLTSILDRLGRTQNENTSLMMKLHSLNDVLRVSCAVLLDSCSPMDGYFTTIAALPQRTEVLTLPRAALCLFVWLWENSFSVRERAYPIPRLVFPTGARLSSASLSSPADWQNAPSSALETHIRTFFKLKMIIFCYFQALVREYACMVPCDGPAAHPGCIPYMHPVFFG